MSNPLYAVSVLNPTLLLSWSRWGLILWGLMAVGGFGRVAGVVNAAAAVGPSSAELRLSVYATAGDILRHLDTDGTRQHVLNRLRLMQVRRVFLEGRRGDEYVSPEKLIEVRAFLETRGMRCSGGIATVPGGAFGVRQVGDLGWLNWENRKTQEDVARFFTENAPLFDELIVDDFYCTADTSAESEQARRGRDWGEYRRDLLVSLLQPMMFEPVRRARPATQLILKFPQWYDRFHLFGYDPARMAAPFHEIWVGTEVRDPMTRRMGFVQPTEGYINFSWIRSIAGSKVVGAWFDHIECSEQHFVDQAFQSVLAGARELTLFRLGDLMESHPGDSQLMLRWKALSELAGKVAARERQGVSFYKPPGSDPGENLYLADYLAVLGWPVLMASEYPARAKLVFLGAQAAADREVVAKLEASIRGGATVVVTPDFVRRAGPKAGALAGVQVGTSVQPGTVSEVRVGEHAQALARPLDVDLSLRTSGATVLWPASSQGEVIPVLTAQTNGRARVLVLNVRTFSEQDFRNTGEWLLAPRQLGLAELPDRLANALRHECFGDRLPRLEAPANVGIYLFKGAACAHNFRDAPVNVRVGTRTVGVRGHEVFWLNPLEDP